jgi:hypothetical protein
MHLRILILLIVLPWIMSCNNRKYDFSSEIYESYEFIVQTNNDEFSRFKFLINNCLIVDSSLHSLNLTIENMNKIRTASSELIDSTSSIEEIQIAYQEYLYSLSQIPLYHEIIIKETEVRKKIEFISDLSLLETQLLIKVKLNLIEIKIRSEILSRWAIDC